MKTALITGINGQDGSYLAELLLAKNYRIIGTVKNQDSNLMNIKNIKSLIEILYYDLNENKRIEEIIQQYLPDEIYHLASNSFVSFNNLDEENFIKINSIPVQYILNSIYKFTPNSKFFLAGSSEMFGLSNQSPQNENSIFAPQSIYGKSKLKAYEILKDFRQKNKIFACCGILYNHESPRRNAIFITRKITQYVAKIACCEIKNDEKLELGDINSARDFGDARAYVQAMYLMLQSQYCQDYIIASNRLYKIIDILEIAFGYLNLDYREFIKINPDLIRPSPKIQLLGDNSKIIRELNWQPTQNLDKIIFEMIENDIALLKTKNKIN
ncbi:MAG: GDP-mannose 4,6-dehydratase [Rickettsiales bacterium]